jgi:hypothetical protein
MRKRLITPISQDARSRDEGWLDLDGVAVVEVTSEEKEYPVHQGMQQREGFRASKRHRVAARRLAGSVLQPPYQRNLIE